MKEELRKIEYSEIQLYRFIGEDGKVKEAEVKKEYGYFHKWVTTDENEYALIEKRDGYVCKLSIFDYNIKFINEFPKGRVLDIKID